MKSGQRRKTIRLPEYDYSWIGAYFITICVRRKECILGQIKNGEIYLNEIGDAIHKNWFWLEKRFKDVKLDEFIVMPNHIHGIILNTEEGGSRTAPTTLNKRKPLGRLIGAFKTVSTKEVNNIRNTPGQKLWQRNYYEHIIRNENDLQSIRHYIKYNPLKWDNDPEFRSS